MNSHCSKCKKELPPGSTKYILSIRLFADFDGHVETSDGEHNIEDIEELIDALSTHDEDKAEKDVHQEMAFLLCRNCRNDFSRNPLNMKVDEAAEKGAYQGILH